MSRLKILVTTSTFPRWGEDTEPDFIYELSRRLTVEFDVFVLCPYAKEAKRYEERDSLRIFRYRYLPFNWGTLAYDGGIVPKLKKNRLYFLQVPFFLLCQLFAINRIVVTHGIDIINAHWVIPQGLVAVLFKLLYRRDNRIMVTVLGADIFAFRSRLGKWLKKVVLKNVDRITVISNAIKEEIHSFGIRDEISVCHLGVDTLLFHPDRNDVEIRNSLEITGSFLLYVGRLAEKKGVSYLLRAMPEIIVREPTAKLVIIGDGVLRKELLDLCQELRIERNVLFLGAIPHDRLPAFFASADLVLFPSIVAVGGDTEGLGLVAAEAMSCGTTVIASDLPAVRDIVTDRITGYLVNQKDPSAISSRVLEIIGNNPVLPRTGKAAREFVVRNFEWDEVACQYGKYLSSLSMR